MADLDWPNRITFTKEDIIEILLSRASATLHCWKAAVEIIEKLPEDSKIEFVRNHETQTFLDKNDLDLRKALKMNPSGKIEDLEK